VKAEWKPSSMCCSSICHGRAAGSYSGQLQNASRCSNFRENKGFHHHFLLLQQHFIRSFPLLLLIPEGNQTEDGGCAAAHSLLTLFLGRSGFQPYSPL